MYAALALGYLEEKTYTQVKENFYDDIQYNITNIWKRYLDDKCIIWKIGHNEL